MFTTLLETRPRRARSPRDAALSFGVHALLIASAVAATANSPVATATPAPVEGVIFMPPRSAPPVVRASSPNPPTTSPTDPRVPFVDVIIAPVEIPNTIPPAVPSDPFPTIVPTTSAAPGTPNGTTTPGGANGTWTVWLVEKPAMALPGAIPVYPDMLRASGTEGDVLAQFVVDTLGRVEAGSFHAVRASHALFAQSVQRVLPRLRFVPAEVGGRRARQLVQQPFQFAITR